MRRARRVTHPAHSPADARGLYTRRTRCILSRPYVTAGGTGSALSVPAAPAQCARTPTHGYLPETRKQPPRPRRFHTNSRREVEWGGRVVPLDNRPVASRRQRTVGCLCEDRGNVGP